MSEDNQPAGGSPPAKKEVPENRTVEKLQMEKRRLRGYIAVFKNYADSCVELEKLVWEFYRVDRKAFGLPELVGWQQRFAHAVEHIALARSGAQDRKVWHCNICGGEVDLSQATKPGDPNAN
jgi:hypothetical protein